MRAKELIDHQKIRPFQPFRVIMNDGKTYDVRHPELIKVTKTTLLYFYADDKGEIDRWKAISVLLIETIVHIDAAAAAAG